MRSTSSTNSSQTWLRAALLGGGLLALARVLGLGDAGTLLGQIPEICVFHRVTGIQCPGCGMTRAFLCLLHGDWRGAWDLNPFSLPLAALLLLLAVLPAEFLQRLSMRPLSKTFGWVCVGLILVWWLGTRFIPYFKY